MKKYALAEIILAGVFWGTSAIFVHYLAPFGVSSLQMTFIRSIVSFLILFLYILIRNRALLRTTTKELLLFFGAGVSFFGTASCYYMSMQMTSIATAVILMYTAPIFVMLYSVLFLGEKLTPLKLVSVILMLIGCGFVSGVVGGLKFDLAGIIFGFLAGIFYSAYNIFTKIEMRKKSNPVTATFYCFLFAAIIGIFLCKPAELPALIAKGNAVLPLMAALGICTCIIPYTLYTLALKTLPAGTASALAIIEPMSATLFGITLFHDPMDIYSVCGIVLILAAVFLLGKSGGE